MSINKTIKLVGKRALELPYENYLKWQKEADHWVSGREIEWRILSTHNWRHNYTPSFIGGCEYRIKPREPKPGEVYLVDNEPVVYCPHVNDEYEYFSLLGACVAKDDGDMTYAAPNIEAWVARKLANEAKLRSSEDRLPEELSLLDIVKEAAMLKEE